jgi:hypothetical protein
MVKHKKLMHLSLFFIVMVMFYVGCSAKTNNQLGITGVAVTDSEVEISTRFGNQNIQLIELRPYEKYERSKSYPTLWQGKGKRKIVISRFEGKKDRIYSKFLLIDSGTKEPLSNCRYVTDFSRATSRKVKLTRPKNIKGLTCIVDINDAVELGVKYVTENIIFSNFIDWRNTNSQDFWEFEGTKIPLNMEQIRKYDRRLKRFDEAGIGVFAIFLNPMSSEREPGNPLLHPDADVENSPTHLGAFNVTSDEGLKYYLGALEFLADRYTREDAKYGQISSFVIGNELQVHWVWHNMGLAPQDKVIREYLLSLRLAWLALQKYHHDLRVYVSMEHHWTRRGITNDPLRDIAGNVLLQGIAQGGKAEGDFPWNVAFHPYPEDLFEPRFWLDRTVKDDFSTPKITFKNLEVLPRFMKQEDMLYRGHVRDIALTEQGFHIPDGPEGEKAQAAAYAYAYYKISRIPEISAFNLHRHVDHRDEGGLKLGLWTNEPNDSSPEKPLKKKLIWEVFQKADTSQWEQAFEFAKPILGIERWGQVPQAGYIEARSPFQVDTKKIVYDFAQNFGLSRGENNMACKDKDILRAAGWIAPAIFQHPPKKGTGKFTYTLTLPQKEGLAMLFETMFGRDSDDGVRFSICINDEEIWSSEQQDKSPVAHRINLNQWMGQEIRVNFLVNKRENENNDWAYWVHPIIVEQKEQKL